jgi:hypothetical protein
MKNKIISLLTVLFLLASIFSVTSAQSYSFQMTREDIVVTVNLDGTETIDYLIDFSNAQGALPIDFIDIGMPNSDYVLSSVTAEVNGKQITDIQASQYVKPGIALGLGGNAIPPGATGQVHCRIGSVTNILFPGTAKETESYASFQFMPNYFDSKYVFGKTDLTLTIVLPKGLKQEEPRYYPPKNWPGDQAPQSGFDSKDQVFYTWHSPDASGSDKYTFGVSFPARLVPAAAIVSPPPASFNIDWTGNSCVCVFVLFLLAIVGSGFYSAIWGDKKRKLAYLPPKISIEGHGVKRGLTAVEAAILMETPMDKVLTMVLFSVIKKNAAKVVTRDPLKLEAITPAPEGMQTYEIDFLKAFESEVIADRRKALQDLMIAVVKSVAEKMKGFSRKETVAYYEDIIKRAWEQVETANTPEVKSQKYDEFMGWTMLSHDYSDRTTRTFGQGPVFLPMWWGNYDPGYHPSVSSSSIPSTPSGSGRSISMPTLPGSDFAASMVNGVQSFSAGVIGDITAFTGGVTNKTNPIPVTSSSSYRGGGGGGRSCACACACAGCACACAGGGR